MNKPFPPPITPDPTLPSPAPPFPVPGPAVFPPSLVPVNETPISMLPPASPLTGAEWTPMVQGGITVRAQLNSLLTFIQLPSPVPVSLGGTGTVYFPPYSILFGTPTQIGSIFPDPGGAVLVGGTPPHFTGTGDTGTFLQGQGAGNDPIWSPIAGIPGPEGPVGPTGAQGGQGQVGRQGPPGPQGFQGNNGLTGPPGETSVVIGSFKNKAASQLPPSGLVPADWDAPGSPPANVQFDIGEGMLYVPTNQIWSYVGTDYTPAGWVNLGDIQGPPGASGPQGPQGALGPVGPQGPDGLQGPIGIRGPEGQVGPQGPQGQQGPRGDPGPQGVDGPQGDQGVDGPQGVEGVPGPAAQSVLIVGSFTVSNPIDLPPSGFLPIDWDSDGNPPTNVQMLIGQGLVDTNTEVIWSYIGTSISPSGWANVGNVVGPQGPQGIQGPQGENGDLGPTGPRGPQGPQGSSGPTGAQGDQGDQGEMGPMGPQGANAAQPAALFYMAAFQQTEFDLTVADLFGTTLVLDPSDQVSAWLNGVKLSPSSPFFTGDFQVDYVNSTVLLAQPSQDNSMFEVDVLPAPTPVVLPEIVVYTDDTLTGDGSINNPLSVASLLARISALESALRIRRR